MTYPSFLYKFLIYLEHVLHIGWWVLSKLTIEKSICSFYFALDLNVGFRKGEMLFFDEWVCIFRAWEAMLLGKESRACKDD